MFTTNDTNEMTDEEAREFFYLDPVPPTPTPNETQANEILWDEECVSHHFVDILKTPDYLLPTSNSTAFEQMFRDKIAPLNTSIGMEELRQMAVVLYQLHVLELEKFLWATYFRAGTGLLKPNASHLKIWPSMVKKIIQFKQHSTTMTDLQEVAVDDNRCLRFVHEHQCELDKRQQELYLKKRQFSALTIDIESILQIFLQEHLQGLCLKYECKMKLVEFDYREQVLQYTFLQQKPRQQQKEIAKHLFECKYDCEKAKEEAQWMKKQVVEQQKIPRSIAAVGITLPFAIPSLTDMDLRQNLVGRHNRIAKHYRSEMTALFMDVTEAKLQESEKIFDEEMAKLWQDQHTLPSNERFNPAMLDYIDRHLALITEKVQCLYHYKHTIVTL